MNVFEVVKENVTARQAAEAYQLPSGRICWQRKEDRDITKTLIKICDAVLRSRIPFLVVGYKKYSTMQTDRSKQSDRLSETFRPFQVKTPDRSTEICSIDN